MSGNGDDYLSEVPAWEGYVVACIAGVFFVSVIVLGYDAFARGALVSAATILATIRLFWPLRRRLWFWFAMLVITIGHVAAVLLVPLSGDAFRGAGIVPVAVLSIVVTIAVMNLLAKRIEGRRESDVVR